MQWKMKKYVDISTSFSNFNDNLKVIYSHSYSDHMPIFGGLYVGIFIVVWCISVFIPALIVIFYVYNHMLEFYIFIILCIFSYTPFVPRIKHSCFHYVFSRYFKKSSLVLEDENVLNHPRTVFAFSPHGIIFNLRV
jgi:hypothetical protein